jgi:hypothetical protein
VAQLQRRGQLLASTGPANLVADRRAHANKLARRVSTPGRPSAPAFPPDPLK